MIKNIVALLLCSFQMLEAIDPEFVVVIPSFNNEGYVEENLTSLFTQDYPKWEMIYINDASSDKTVEKMKCVIEKYGMEKRCQLISNQKRMGAMANIYNAVHRTSPEKIIVLLDGDDALKGPHVLSKIAKIYKKKNIWMTYGNYEAKPTTTWTNDPCIPIPKKVIQNHFFRYSSFIYYPLRTFYAKLFQLIKPQDLMWKGQFLPVVSDTGYMLPMLEMAADGHIQHVSKVLYIYHVDNPINDFKTKLPLMKEVSAYIRSIPPYKPLKRLF